VTRICRVLDGLPLAIELAAARIATMTLPDILRRVAGSLDLLAGGPRDAPPRQRTLRETIAWSYVLLDPDQQALFRRLGVFVGGCTLDAASAVASTGNDDPLDVLTALVDASLLDVVPGPMGVTRYVMLDTIRAFALERLAADDDEGAVRAAHARYFMTLAEAALPGYDGPELMETNARMAAELDNARAAIAWAYAAGERDIAVRLSGALWHVWLYPAFQAAAWIDRIADGWQYLERALAASAGLPVAAVTEAYTGAAHFACLRGEVDRAQRIAEELAARAGAVDDPYARHWAAAELGYVALARGDLVEAARHYEDALALAPLIRDPENHAAICLIHLGAIALRRGDPTSGAKHVERARELVHICGNPFLDGKVLLVLGQCRRELRNYPAAIGLLTESHAAFRRRKNGSGMAAALVALAIVALRLGNTERAQRLLQAVGKAPRMVTDVAEFGIARAVLRAATGAGLEDLPNGETLTPDAPEVSQILEAMQAEIIAAHDLQASPSPGGLTPRELEILRLVATGKSNRAIADALSISERTVENHLSHMLAKLNVDSRTAAVAMAVDLGIVEPRRPASGGQYLDRPQRPSRT
jgi:DNA-binding CsgD family transcriptional regulator/tetratricopeptide (TPR) repeat protein